MRSFKRDDLAHWGMTLPGGESEACGASTDNQDIIRLIRERSSIGGGVSGHGVCGTGSRWSCSNEGRTRPRMRRWLSYAKAPHKKRQGVAFPFVFAGM